MGGHDQSARGNLFEDCLSSGSENGDRWEWGEAIITITPSHLPQGADAKPYHRNIRIEGNAFRTFDLPLLRARSVRGLGFSGNTVERTRTLTPFAYQQAAFWLDGCREVTLHGNRYDEAYEGRTIWSEHMRPADLVQDDGRSFTVTPGPTKTG